MLDAKSLDSFSALLADPRYDALQIQWRACMEHHGETRFSTSADTMNRPWPEPRGSNDEIRVAALDTARKAQIDFVAVCVGIEDEWQSQDETLIGAISEYDSVAKELLGRL